MSETVEYEFHARIRKYVTSHPSTTGRRYNEDEKAAVTTQGEIINITLRGGPELAQQISDTLAGRMAQDTKPPAPTNS